MKRIHLLAHHGPPDGLAPLFEAARREGLRVGWLDLGAGGAPPETGGAPAELAWAAAAGAFRAVAVTPGRVVAVKTPTGPPVLRNLLREHFLGCALVVVRHGGKGAPPELEAVPRIEAGDGVFRIAPPDGAPRELTAEALVARLRRPRPFG